MHQRKTVRKEFARSRMVSRKTLNNWIELEKFVYFRKLLTGAAQICCKTTESIFSYEDLKINLLRNLRTNVTSYSIKKICKVAKNYNPKAC